MAASVPWLLIFHVRDIGLAEQHYYSPALSFLRVTELSYHGHEKLGNYSSIVVGWSMVKLVTLYY